MSFEKSDSDNVSNSASVTGPPVMLDVVEVCGFLVVVDDCGKKLCGFPPGPETAPGGFPQAFGTDKGGRGG